MPDQLAKQFLLDFGAMLLAAFLLAQLPSQAGFLTRLLVVVACGCFPAVRAQIPLWNWYGFPKQYVAAQVTVDIVGFVLGGLILAKIVHRGSKSFGAAA
jgi:hypothetical protein